MIIKSLTENVHIGRGSARHVQVSQYQVIHAWFKESNRA